jgi:hypothetical protein
MAEPRAKKGSVVSDDLDVSLEPVSRKKSGGGWGTAIAVLILIAAVAVVVLLVVRSQERIRAEEAQKRADARQQQLTAMGTSLLGATDKIKADDYAGAMEIVGKAGASLDSLIREAGEAKDEDALTLLTARKRELDQAKVSIQDLHQVFVDEATKRLTTQADALSAGQSKHKEKAAPGGGNAPEGAPQEAPAAAPAANAPAPPAAAAPGAPAAPAAAPAPAVPPPAPPAGAPPAAPPPG